ncbi:MAG: hypothetical protein EB072_19070 [Betaproteobacteria bacterium]|nr:hypothetical protein [Betaproteobacteria bacterium]
MNLAARNAEITDIPMSFRPRSGKTVIVLPDGSRGVVRREATIDNTMIKVIARGFRWQRLLYDGTYATIEDLSAAERINPSYVSRILRVAYLSPVVVQAILDGKHPVWLTMRHLLEPFPTDWKQQEKKFLGQSRT